MRSRFLVLISTGCLCLLVPPVVHAIEPAEVFLIVNKNVPESLQLARHYSKVRNIPSENLLQFDLPTGENISRSDYNTKLRDSLRKSLQDKKQQVEVLLTFYGVPLRVGGEPANDEEKKVIAQVNDALKKLRDEESERKADIAKLEKVEKESPTDAGKKKLADLRSQTSNLARQIRVLNDRRKWLSHAESQACVDSELMLLWWDDYELRRWQVNLLNWRVPEDLRKKGQPIVMACRLDGPSPAIVQRLIDDAVAVEKNGLQGKVYVDARGIKYNGKDAYGYGGYDQALRDMAELLKNDAKMSVVLDDKGPLFAEGACPDAALYCGWYALANYRACCKFSKGAVAYHIASSEAVSLRNPKAKFWCPNLLKDGVVATLGPVAEPYTIGFPKPAEFFGLLVTGEYTLVECYSKTLLLNSWMTVLVGDPLYNPYKNNRKLNVRDVRESPRDSPFLLRAKSP